MTATASASSKEGYEASRTKRLKAATREAHQMLDAFITAAQPFQSRQRFGTFLKTQYLFHRELEAYFNNPVLDALLPDLKGRRRLPLIEQDLTDLDIAVPTDEERQSNLEPFDLARAMGWLYVVEGSNLGAAFLLKDAAKLGLDERFGARHLGGAAEGRGLHWKTFTAALDAIELDAEEEQRTIAGAEAAFRSVHAYAKRMMV